MAVKQKVRDHVDSSSNEARLQIILRTLQNITAQDGLGEKHLAQIVLYLGTVSVPTDVISFKKFVEDIENVKNILAKECSNKMQIFTTLKALYDEISIPNKQLSPAMSIVLQLLDEDLIPKAVKYILNSGYPEQSLEQALHTLCHWLTKWTCTNNLGPLVLAFMKGLEQENHFDVLMKVTMQNIALLFRLIILPDSRKGVGPVVCHMLSRVQHSPQVFHRIVPIVKVVCEQLNNEKSESSLFYLRTIVNLCAALTEHFPGHPALYEPLKIVLQSYRVGSGYKTSLGPESWCEGVANRSSAGKVGLNNLGNTCYMNSVLQALFATRTFRNEVLLHSNESSSPPQLFLKLQSLFALLQHSKKLSLSPGDILNSSRPPGFLPGHQHDSSEFLGYLLDTLHEQQQEKTSGNGSEASGAFSLPLTVVQQSFGGKTATVSGCGRCATKSERTDDFRELQLSFPSNCDDQSVQTLLDYYLQPEKLSGDNQYHCDVCGGLTDGERRTSVVQAPARLILTLKHFRYDSSSQLRTKLLQRVKLNDMVRLGAYQYELYASVVHCGSSLDSGHYYTFARDKTNDWYKFNDCSVTRTRPDDLCKLRPPETPYILFYSRRDVAEPEDLSFAVLCSELQLELTKDRSKYDLEKKRNPRMVKVYPRRNGNGNDEPPPPGCGGGGFGPSSGNMFVC